MVDREEELRQDQLEDSETHQLVTFNRTVAEKKNNRVGTDVLLVCTPAPTSLLVQLSRYIGGFCYHPRILNVPDLLVLSPRW